MFFFLQDCLKYQYVLYIVNLNFDDLTVAAGGVMRIAHISKIFKDGLQTVHFLLQKNNRWVSGTC